MGTRLEYTKGGVRLLCNVSTLPVPRPKQAFPLPEIPIKSTSLLSLNLVDVLSTARKGIQISSIGATLSGGPDAVWTLLWMYYQGSRPISPTWIETPVQPPVVSYLVESAMPLATYIFCLRKVESGQITLYPEATINTPDDTTQKDLSDLNSVDALTNADKAKLIQDWKAEAQVKTQLDAQATSMGVSSSTYDAAVNALSTNLIAAGAPSNWATTWPDGTTWSHTGILTSLQTWWAAIASARTALQNAMTGAAQATGSSAGAIAAQTNSVDYLTNAAKIQLLKDWSSEQSLKTQLDSQASTQGVASGIVTAYDNAVAAVSTVLTTAGAPSNWATTWPNGTTSGPWTGIQNSIRNAWATVAEKRTTLQNAIAGQQAAAAGSAAISTAAADATTKANSAYSSAVSDAATDATTKANTAYANAKADAISAAATDATTKSNAAILASQPHQVAWAYASKPSLPSASYPAGYYAITSDNRTVQVNAAGTAWSDVLVATTGLFGQIVANQLVLTNLDNLIPNPNSEQTAPTGGWPSGAYEAVALDSSVGQAYSGNNFRSTQNYSLIWLSDFIPVGSGDLYYIEAYAKHLSGNSARFGLAWYAADKTTINNYLEAATTSTTYTKISANGAAPANTAFARAYIQSGTAGTWACFDNLYARRMADGNLIVDGAVTATKIGAGQVTAVKLDAQAITAKTMVMANFDNLIPNPNSEQAAPTGGWPSGAWEAVGLNIGGGYQGNNCRVISSSTSGINNAQITPVIPINPGDSFYGECYIRTGGANHGGTGSALVFRWFDASGASIGSYACSWVTQNYPFAKSSGVAVAPANAVGMACEMYSTQDPTGPHTIIFDSFYVRRMADANLIVDGGVTAQKVAAQAITTRELTVANFDNLVANPNSALTTTSGSAWPSGSYESASLATDTPGSGVSGSRKITQAAGTYGSITVAKVPCAPGDRFYVEAMCWTTATATDVASQVIYFDAAGTTTGDDGTPWDNGPSNAPSWAKTKNLPGAAPANTAWAEVRLYFRNRTGGSASGWFGMIYARKMADANVIVDGTLTAQKLTATAIQTTNYTEDGSGNPTAGAALKTAGTALKVVAGGMQIGTYVFTDYFYRQLQAIDGANGGRVVYRGNVDVTTRGGAPNIGCLSVTRRRWDTTYKVGRLELAIQPTAATDNLDSMRFAMIQLYRQSAAGTSGTLTSLDTYYLPMTDRSYGNFSSDSNSTNVSKFTFETVDAGVSTGVPAAIVTLYNAYGASAGNCFYSGGSSDGSALTNNGTSFPSGLTGGSGGGSGGGGGGGGGGFCPAPWVKIQLASGLLVDAADLYDGAQVVGVNDSTLEPMTGIVRNPGIAWADRVPVFLEDGRAPEFSLPHRVMVEGRGWTEVRNLQPGDSIVAQMPSIVRGLGKPIKAQVVDFIVEGCHTYFSDGLLSHNAKILT